MFRVPGRTAGSVVQLGDGPGLARLAPGLAVDLGSRHVPAPVPQVRDPEVEHLVTDGLVDLHSGLAALGGVALQRDGPGGEPRPREGDGRGEGGPHGLDLHPELRVDRLATLGHGEPDVPRLLGDERTEGQLGAVVQGEGELVVHVNLLERFAWSPYRLSEPH